MKESAGGYYMAYYITSIKGLTLLEKNLLAWVMSYHRNGRVFYVSNAVIEQVCSVSHGTISKTIDNLYKNDYIEKPTSDGRKRYIKPSDRLLKILSPHTK